MIQNIFSGKGSVTNKVDASLWTLLQKSEFILNFNWASVLFVSFFLAYGYYGAITPDLVQLKGDIASSAVVLGVLTSILVFFGVLASKALGEYWDSIRLRGVDLLVFLLSFAVFFSVSYSKLQYSLYSDEISYSATSHGHSIRLTMVLSGYTHALDDVPFQYLVQTISLILLISLAGCILFRKDFPGPSGQ